MIVDGFIDEKSKDVRELAMKWPYGSDSEDSGSIEYFVIQGGQLYSPGEWTLICL